MKNSSVVGPLFIMIAAFLWALDALIRTPLTQTIPAASIVLYEHLAGLLILSPIFIKSVPILRQLTIKTWLSVILLTLVSSIGGTILFTQALGASFATGDFITPLLLLKLQPVFVIVLSMVILKEKISKKFLFWAPLALVGSYLMSFGTTIPNISFSGKELVVLLSLGATFCWGGGTIISKTLLRSFSTRDTTFLRFLVAVPIGLLVAILLKQTYPLSAITTPDALRFGLIAISTGAVGLLIYYYGLSRTAAHVSTIAELIFPLTSVVIGITALNPYGAPQMLTAPQLIGIVILIIAVIKISFLQREIHSMVVKGPIIRGSRDGTKLGFPTANVGLSTKLSLEFGVYAVLLTVDGETHKGVLHYGPRLVFNETKPQFEVHILDFKKNIYDKEVRVEVKDFIRKTLHFSSLKKMVTQIEKDCVAAREKLL